MVPASVLKRNRIEELLHVHFYDVERAEACVLLESRSTIAESSDAVVSAALADLGVSRSGSQMAFLDLDPYRRHSVLTMC